MNNHFEPLLWEKAQSDGPGVDWPDVELPESKTGLPKCGDLGLPQVKEPEVVRHFVRLSHLNYSIDQGFFPLGSCTMKHNPRLNEKLARLNGFANLHPMQPIETCQGALEVMYELQNWLGELTGLPGVCLTPAAGAQGELAGMMTIKRRHELNGEAESRKYVLVPDSAHGTNPSTAVMCGYTPRIIDTKATGRVSVDEFEAALTETDPDGKDIAGMMVTNPNTCGLFEKDIVTLADRLHAAGGYFYCDGANFNALVGTIRPADFGVDVMHINLHKTFSTPHGGGGPGSGPICVTDELAPYLPYPLVIKDNNQYRLEEGGERKTSLGRMKGFQGQFGMHVRALAYMMSHGGKGLKQVSEDAVLNANYVFAGLKDHYHAPYDAPFMHECLISDKRQKDGEGNVTTIDIAKSLIDAGIHPMTVYFPMTVAGSMLIEPTETETKENLDNFIKIMVNISEKSSSFGGAEILKTNPQNAPRKRLDEVKAAREPVLIIKR